MSSHSWRWWCGAALWMIAALIVCFLLWAARRPAPESEPEDMWQGAWSVCETCGQLLDGSQTAECVPEGTR